jgi:predicted acetyltransferase
MSHLDQPLDAASAESLASQGLRLALVDTADHAAFDSWLRADLRGFHSEVADEQLPTLRDAFAYRRTTAVYDDGIAEPASPVATVNSWTGELGVPGDRVVPAWAISSVTVAPTHRRRGVARALLEAELRTASALGVPMAMLTVSESTLYERYGFGPAAFASDYRIDTSRVRWSGSSQPGRIHMIGVDEYLARAPELFERIRVAQPGQMELWPLRWAEIAGQHGADAAKARRVRAIRYDDVEGTPRGYAVYDVTGGDGDYTAHVATLRFLLADGADAYAALWRYVLELPLVRTVVAPLRSVDEPVRWMLGDWRAATSTTVDHLWLRVLDLPAAFAARGAADDGAIGLSVDDPSGLIAGDWRVEARDGRFTATRVPEPSPELPVVALDAAALASLYLGGVSAVTLAAAGRVHERTVGAAAVADRLLRSPHTPWLGVWF